MLNLFIRKAQFSNLLRKLFCEPDVGNIISASRQLAPGFLLHSEYWHFPNTQNFGVLFFVKDHEEEQIITSYSLDGLFQLLSWRGEHSVYLTTATLFTGKILA
jgi:hypothetical protein